MDWVGFAKDAGGGSKKKRNRKEKKKNDVTAQMYATGALASASTRPARSGKGNFRGEKAGKKKTESAAAAQKEIGFRADLNLDMALGNSTNNPSLLGDMMTMDPMQKLIFECKKKLSGLDLKKNDGGYLVQDEKELIYLINSSSRELEDIGKLCKEAKKARQVKYDSKSLGRLLFDVYDNKGIIAEQKVRKFIREIVPSPYLDFGEVAFREFKDIQLERQRNSSKSHSSQSNAETFFHFLKNNLPMEYQMLHKRLFGRKDDSAHVQSPLKLFFSNNSANCELPSKMELLCNIPANLSDLGRMGERRNFDNTYEYKKTLYCALRRDMIGSMQKSFRQVYYDEDLENSRLENARLYEDCVLRGTDQDIMTGVQYRLEHKPIPKNKDFQKKFGLNENITPGTLAFLSSDDFTTHIAVVVANFNDEDQVMKPYIDVNLTNQKDIIHGDRKYRMLVFSGSFFESFKHSLEAIRHLPNDFPFHQQIVHTNLEDEVPEMLQKVKGRLDMSSVFSRSSEPLITNVLKKNNWKIESKHYSNTQLKALRASLTKSFSIVHGPPGTGKTHVAQGVIKCLLDNPKLRNGPILIIGQTNETVDLLLSKVKDAVLETPLRPSKLKFEVWTGDYEDVIGKGGKKRRKKQTVEHEQFPNIGKIIRVGNQSSKEMEPFNKKYLIPKKKSGFFSLIEEQNALSEEIELTEGRLQSIIPHLSNLKPSHKSLIQEYFQKKYHKTLSDLEKRLDKYDTILEKDFLESYNKEKNGKKIITKETTNDNNELLASFMNSRKTGKGSKKKRHQQQQQEQEQEQKQKQEQEFASPSNAAKELIKLCQHYAGVIKEKQYVVCCEEELRNIAEKGYDNETEARVRAAVYEELNVDEKAILLARWCLERREGCVDDLIVLNNKYNKLSEEAVECSRERTVDILRAATIVGMTTTAAAKNKSVIDSIGAQIVIMEESAEIDEARFLTSIPRTCKQLIQIGDHNQLQPSLACNMNRDHDKSLGLGFSLFERLVSCGYDHIMLDVQHRMIPQISSLVGPFYDYKLKDGPNVTKRDDVTGLDASVYFIDSDQFEDDKALGSTSSHNTYEAEYCAHLARYLMQQGEKAKDIVILTFYKDQRRLIRSIMEDFEEQFRNVRVSAVDNFQGQERRIVIFSAVRSNEHNVIGYCGKPNRICVALSRAQDALYFIGNVKQFENVSHFWKKVVANLDDTSRGKAMTGSCITHDTPYSLSCSDDFKQKCPDGGCHKECGKNLICGHKCPRKCHPLEDHNVFPCGRDCTWRCPQCERPCRKRCSDECNDVCLKTVNFVNSCPNKHFQVQIPCHKNAFTAACPERCGVKLPCGHECPGVCSECMKNEEHHKCIQPCPLLLPCGHPCRGLCGEACPPCQEICSNKCGIEEHQISSIPDSVPQSECVHLCGRKCKGCSKKAVPPCEHYELLAKRSGSQKRDNDNKKRLKCCDIESSWVCNEQCSKKLECGCACVGLCGEECPPCPRHCGGGIYADNQIFNNQVDDTPMKFIKLDCGHVFEVEYLDNYLNVDSHGKPISSMGDDRPRRLTFPMCPAHGCTEQIQTCHRYQRLIKSTWNHLNRVRGRTAHVQEQIEDVFNGVTDFEIESIVELFAEFGLESFIHREALEFLLTKVVEMRENPADIQINDAAMIYNRVELLRQLMEILKPLLPSEDGEDELDGLKQDRNIRGYAAFILKEAAWFVKRCTIEDRLYKRNTLLPDFKEAFERLKWLDIRVRSFILGCEVAYGTREVSNKDALNAMSNLYCKLLPSEILRITKAVETYSPEPIVTLKKPTEINIDVGGPWFVCSFGHLIDDSAEKRLGIPICKTCKSGNRYISDYDAISVMSEFEGDSSEDENGLFADEVEECKNDDNPSIFSEDIYGAVCVDDHNGGEDFWGLDGSNNNEANAINSDNDDFMDFLL
eukprot:TRINITY_DN331_c0_g1_i2.p1 TRINITY_DN331_c0_g1~~TRINITY_DN331_c0_g1_i2.p1  ORF type:complete len:1916 (-),score=604.98 TRINITY_DN331_c0_g1_i2:289-6036(-)